MKRVLKSIILILVTMSFLACGKKEKFVEDGTKGKINYKRARLVEGNLGKLNNISVSSGTLDSINEIEESINSRGDVVKINYKNGDKVQVGDVVLVLENQEVYSAYLDSKARVITTEADYEMNKNSHAKYQKLYEENLISEDEYLNIKNKLALSKGNYNSAKASLQKNKKDYEDLVVRAKINGTIANLDLKVYEKVEAKSPLFKIVDNENLRILSGVSSKDILDMKIGAKANIFVEGLKEPIQGILYEINPVSNLNTRKFEVKIKIDNKDLKFKQGMFARVELEAGEREGVLVPKEAIIIEELYSYVFVAKLEEIEVEKDGKKELQEVLVAKKIKVEMGTSSGENQEIISDELKEKNKVVVEGQYSLSDGDYIKEIN